MSAQVYSVPDQTERKEGLGKTWTYPITYLLHVRVMLKSVDHPIPTCGNREHPSNFQNKSVSSPFS